jgi:hypothetical protein
MRRSDLDGRIKPAASSYAPLAGSPRGLAGLHGSADESVEMLSVSVEMSAPPASTISAARGATAGRAGPGAAAGTGAHEPEEHAYSAATLLIQAAFRGQQARRRERKRKASCTYRLRSFLFFGGTDVLHDDDSADQPAPIWFEHEAFGLLGVPCVKNVITVLLLLAPFLASAGSAIEVVFGCATVSPMASWLRAIGSFSFCAVWSALFRGLADVTRGAADNQKKAEMAVIRELRSNLSRALDAKLEAEFFADKRAAGGATIHAVKVAFNTTGANATGYDTTGDGNIDSYDTTGDGKVDTSLIDRDSFAKVHPAALASLQKPLAKREHEDNAMILSLLKALNFRIKSPEELQRMTRVFEYVVVEPDEVVVRKGALDAAIYIVLHGSLIVQVGSDESKFPRIIAGQMARDWRKTGGTGRRPATIVSEGISHVLRLGIAELKREKVNPEIFDMSESSMVKRRTSSRAIERQQSMDFELEHDLVHLQNGTQILARDIGVSGWNGTTKGRGTYENEESLFALFATYGWHPSTIFVRHRTQKDGTDLQNTSWALITMKSARAAEEMMDEPVVMAGGSPLRLARFDVQAGLQSTGEMRVAFDASLLANVMGPRHTADWMLRMHALSEAHKDEHLADMMKGAFEYNYSRRISNLTNHQEVVANAARHQLIVRGIGEDGWDGTMSGTGTWEDRIKLKDALTVSYCFRSKHAIVVL